MRKTLALIILLTASLVYGSTTRTITSDNISGLTGDRSYIKNGIAVKNTKGWNGYIDAAGLVPVDGTAGGTPNLTWTVSTATPLSLSGNFLLTKDAVNRQGQGFSYDFSIDRADRGKILTIEMQYEIASGTYADNDNIIYIYDVTKGVLIEPSNIYIKNATVNTIHKATFQTSIDSQSYRLILHQSSVSALAYTIKFNNFKVSAQQIVNGAYVSDWVSWTPTGSWTTNITAYTGKWRRVGDSAEIQAKVATSGASDNIALIINLPSGMTMDTTKMTAINARKNFGFASIKGTPYVGWVAHNTSTSVQVFANDLVTPYSQPVTGTWPGSTAAGYTADIQFSVPILGWGSNVTMSGVDAADGRVVALKAKKITSSQTINTGAAQVVIFNNSVIDTHSKMDTTTGIYTVPVSGIYKISYGLWIETTATPATAIYTYIHKNGSGTFGLAALSDIAALKKYTITGSTLVNCIAGDTLAVYAETAGFAISLGYHATQEYLYLTIDRLSSAASISAGETVAARYNTSAAQNMVTGVTTLVNFGTKDFDTHGAVSVGAAWKFTAPISGKYRVVALINFANVAWELGRYVYLGIYKNNVVISNGGVYETEAIQIELISSTINDIIDLKAGDYIDVRGCHNRTAGDVNLYADGGFNYINIERIGN